MIKFKVLLLSLSLSMPILAMEKEPVHAKDASKRENSTPTPKDVETEKAKDCRESNRPYSVVGSCGQALINAIKKNDVSLAIDILKIEDKTELLAFRDAEGKTALEYARSNGNDALKQAFQVSHNENPNADGTEKQLTEKKDSIQKLTHDETAIASSSSKQNSAVTAKDQDIQSAAGVNTSSIAAKSDSKAVENTKSSSNDVITISLCTEEKAMKKVVNAAQFSRHLVLKSKLMTDLLRADLNSRSIPLDAKKMKSVTLQELRSYLEIIAAGQSKNVIFQRLEAHIPISLDSLKLVDICSAAHYLDIPELLEFSTWRIAQTIIKHQDSIFIEKCRQLSVDLQKLINGQLIDININTWLPSFAMRCREEYEKSLPIKSFEWHATNPCLFACHTNDGKTFSFDKESAEVKSSNETIDLRKLLGYSTILDETQHPTYTYIAAQINNNVISLLDKQKKIILANLRLPEKVLSISWSRINPNWLAVSYGKYIQVYDAERKKWYPALNTYSDKTINKVRWHPTRDNIIAVCDSTSLRIFDLGLTFYVCAEIEKLNFDETINLIKYYKHVLVNKKEPTSSNLQALFAMPQHILFTLAYYLPGMPKGLQRQNILRCMLDIANLMRTNAPINLTADQEQLVATMPSYVQTYIRQIIATSNAAVKEQKAANAPVANHKSISPKSMINGDVNNKHSDNDIITINLTEGNHNNQHIKEKAQFPKQLIKISTLIKDLLKDKTLKTISLDAKKFKSVTLQELRGFLEIETSKQSKTIIDQQLIDCIQGFDLSKLFDIICVADYLDIPILLYISTRLIAKEVIKNQDISFIEKYEKLSDDIKFLISMEISSMRMQTNYSSAISDRPSTTNATAKSHAQLTTKQEVVSGKQTCDVQQKDETNTSAKNGPMDLYRLLEKAQQIPATFVPTNLSTAAQSPDSLMQEQKSQMLLPIVPNNGQLVVQSPAPLIQEQKSQVLLPIVPNNGQLVVQAPQPLAADPKIQDGQTTKVETSSPLKIGLQEKLIEKVSKYNEAVTSFENLNVTKGIKARDESGQSKHLSVDEITKQLPISLTQAMMAFVASGGKLESLLKEHNESNVAKKFRSLLSRHWKAIHPTVKHKEDKSISKFIKDIFKNVKEVYDESMKSLSITPTQQVIKAQTSSERRKKARARKKQKDVAVKSNSSIDIKETSDSQNTPVSASPEMPVSRSPEEKAPDVVDNSKQVNAPKQEAENQQKTTVIKSPSDDKPEETQKIEVVELSHTSMEDSTDEVQESHPVEQEKTKDASKNETRKTERARIHSPVRFRRPEKPWERIKKEKDRQQLSKTKEDLEEEEEKDEEIEHARKFKKQIETIVRNKKRQIFDPWKQLALKTKQKSMSRKMQAKIKTAKEFYEKNHPKHLLLQAFKEWKQVAHEEHKKRLEEKEREEQQRIQKNIEIADRFRNTRLQERAFAVLQQNKIENCLERQSTLKRQRIDDQNAKLQQLQEKMQQKDASVKDAQEILQQKEALRMQDELNSLKQALHRQEQEQKLKELKIREIISLQDQIMRKQAELLRKREQQLKEREELLQKVEEEKRNKKEEKQRKQKEIQRRLALCDAHELESKKDAFATWKEFVADKKKQETAVIQEYKALHDKHLKKTAFHAMRHKMQKMKEMKHKQQEIQRRLSECEARDLKSKKDAFATWKEFVADRKKHEAEVIEKYKELRDKHLKKATLHAMRNNLFDQTSKICEQALYNAYKNIEEVKRVVLSKCTLQVLNKPCHFHEVLNQHRILNAHLDLYSALKRYVTCYAQHGYSLADFINLHKENQKINILPRDTELSDFRKKLGISDKKIMWSEIEDIHRILASSYSSNAALKELSVLAGEDPAFIVQRLLEKNRTSVPLKTNNIRKFIDAVRAHDTERVMKMIRDKKIAVNTHDESSGQTALHIAAAYNYLDLAEALLEHGAAVVIDIEDNYGFTPWTLSRSNAMFSLMVKYRTKQLHKDYDAEQAAEQILAKTFKDKLNRYLKDKDRSDRGLKKSAFKAWRAATKRKKSQSTAHELLRQVCPQLYAPKVEHTTNVSTLPVLVEGSEPMQTPAANGRDTEHSYSNVACVSSESVSSSMQSPMHNDKGHEPKIASGQADVPQSASAMPTQAAQPKVMHSMRPPPGFAPLGNHIHKDGKNRAWITFDRASKRGDRNDLLIIKEQERLAREGEDSSAAGAPAARAAVNAHADRQIDQQEVARQAQQLAKQQEAERKAQQLREKQEADRKAQQLREKQEAERKAEQIRIKQEVERQKVEAKKASEKQARIAWLKKNQDSDKKSIYQANHQLIVKRHQETMQLVNSRQAQLQKDRALEFDNQCRRGMKERIDGLNKRNKLQIEINRVYSNKFVDNAYWQQHMKDRAKENAQWYDMQCKKAKQDYQDVVLKAPETYTQVQGHLFNILQKMLNDEHNKWEYLALERERENTQWYDERCKDADTDAIYDQYHKYRQSYEKYHSTLRKSFLRQMKKYQNEYEKNCANIYANIYKEFIDRNTKGNIELVFRMVQDQNWYAQKLAEFQQKQHKQKVRKCEELLENLKNSEAFFKAYAHILNADMERDQVVANTTNLLQVLSDRDVLGLLEDDFTKKDEFNFTPVKEALRARRLIWHPDKIVSAMQTAFRPFHGYVANVIFDRIQLAHDRLKKLRDEIAKRN